MAAIVEINHDEKGIIWPKEVAPYQVHLIKIENNEEIKKTAESLFRDLQKSGVEVLYDDRDDKTAGEKFNDADLLGIPIRLVVSERNSGEKSIEIKNRNEKKIKIVKISDVQKYI
ncbi:His/Gly/Thr/Pro-type tRNA ligase C-terminal domain-containing protein [Patescibacteria group bacterium]